MDSLRDVAFLLESSFCGHPYRDTSIRVHPRACTSGCWKVLRRCWLGQSAYSARWPPTGSRISPASKFDTTLLYIFVRAVCPSSVVDIQVQTCSPTLSVFSRIVGSFLPIAVQKSPAFQKPSWPTSALRSSTPEKSCV